VGGFVGISGIVNPVVSKAEEGDRILFLVGDSDTIVP